MEQHYSLNDEVFEQAFAEGTFPPDLFTHEAHLRLAWIHLHQYGLATAIDNICAQLIQYTTRLGAADKYNATLTVAAIHVVNHFMGKQPIETFYEFIHTYPRLKHTFKAILAQHYGFDIFHSAQAKSTYLEPDLLAFS